MLATSDLGGIHNLLYGSHLSRFETSRNPNRMRRPEAGPRKIDGKDSGDWTRFEWGRSHRANDRDCLCPLDSGKYGNRLQPAELCGLLRASLRRSAGHFGAASVSFWFAWSALFRTGRASRQIIRTASILTSRRGRW